MSGACCGELSLCKSVSASFCADVDAVQEPLGGNVCVPLMQTQGRSGFYSANRQCQAQQWCPGSLSDGIIHDKEDEEGLEKKRRERC